MSGGYITVKLQCSDLHCRIASMATFRFNSIRIPQKPISTNTYFSKPSKISFPLCSKCSKNHLKPHPFQFNIITKLSVSTQEEVETEEDDYEEGDPTAEMSYLDPETDPQSIVEWELDFCSRPILDARGKKVWELLVCDDSLSLQFTKYFPNNVINSITLKDAIASISEDLGIPLPEKIRFFRSQMQTIITKACKELGIKSIRSKRCVSLLLWLEERYETVYKRHPGFQKGSKPLLALDNPFPMELPDNLFGEKWAFVQLSYSAVREEIASLETRTVFGTSLDLDLLGIEIDDKSLIPGLTVASSRAKPLAAWMNGLEVCAIEADTSRACLILSVGIATR